MAICELHRLRLPQISAIISFSREEQETVDQISHERQRSNRKGGRTNLKFSKCDPLEIEKIGTGGEMAFSKWSGLAMDFNTACRNGGKDGIIYDFRYQGFTLDVKASRTQVMAVAPYQEKAKVQIYCMMHMCSWMNYYLVGFTSHERLFHPFTLKPHYDKEHHVLHGSELYATIQDIPSITEDDGIPF